MVQLFAPTMSPPHETVNQVLVDAIVALPLVAVHPTCSEVLAADEATSAGLVSVTVVDAPAARRSLRDPRSSP